MTGCELLSVVGRVVSDVKFVSKAPVNGLVSDFTVTGVVLTLSSTDNARNNNAISKYGRNKAMTQSYNLQTPNSLHHAHEPRKSKMTSVTRITPMRRSTLQYAALSDTCRNITVSIHLVPALRRGAVGSYLLS